MDVSYFQISPLSNNESQIIFLVSLVWNVTSEDYIVTKEQSYQWKTHVSDTESDETCLESILLKNKSHFLKNENFIQTT